MSNKPVRGSDARPCNATGFVNRNLSEETVAQNEAVARDAVRPTSDMTTDDDFSMQDWRCPDCDGRFVDGMHTCGGHTRYPLARWRARSQRHAGASGIDDHDQKEKNTNVQP